MAGVPPFFQTGGVLPSFLTGVTPSQVSTGGYPHPRAGQGGTPSKVRIRGTRSQVRTEGGIPIPGQDGRYLIPGQNGDTHKVKTGGTPNRNSKACTCYAAGNMPLAFTQKDFLVKLTFRSAREWEAVIGLEIHAQIFTKSKLFSGAGTQYEAFTNEQVAYVDAALPGTLPVRLILDIRVIAMKIFLNAFSRNYSDFR